MVGITLKYYKIPSQIEVKGRNDVHNHIVHFLEIMCTAVTAKSTFFKGNVGLYSKISPSSKMLAYVLKLAYLPKCWLIFQN